MVLNVTEKNVAGKTYRNINLGDLDYATSCTMQMLFDAPKEFESAFKSKFGKPQMSYVYKVLVLEPALGEVSFFARPHLHRDLQACRTGDIITLTAREVKKEFNETNAESGAVTKKKVSYKGYELKKAVMRMTEADKLKVIEAVKSLGSVPTRETIVELLAGDGFTNEDDINDLMKQLS